MLAQEMNAQAGINQMTIFRTTIVMAAILLACVTSHAEPSICFEGEFNPNRALRFAWGSPALHDSKAVWDSKAFFAEHPSKKDIFKRLFASYEESSFVEWFLEKDASGKSYYKQLHPAVSRPYKVLKLKSDGTSIVLITDTVPYDPETLDDYCCQCPVLMGAQLWSRQGTTWCLRAEDRAIMDMNWGVGYLAYEDVKVVKVGPKVMGVLFEDDIGKGGENPVISTLIIPKGAGFILAFSEMTGDGNVGFYGEEDMRAYKYTAKIDFIPGRNKYYFDLRVVTSGTNIGKNNRRIPWNREKIYVMTNGRYVLRADRSVVTR